MYLFPLISQKKKKETREEEKKASEEGKNKENMPLNLVRSLNKLQGETVDIELKNGTKLQGTILTVDQTMTTHLKKVKVTVRGRNPMEMDTLTVRGGNIRYYSLPESVDIDGMLKAATASKNQMKGAAAGGRGGGRGGGGFGGRGRGRGGQ